MGRPYDKKNGVDFLVISNVWTEISLFFHCFVAHWILHTVT